MKATIGFFWLQREMSGSKKVTSPNRNMEKANCTR